MGCKLVPTANLVYAATPSVVPESRIVYQDLVKTLGLDPTKYARPVVDEKDGVVANSIFLRAAKDAGLAELVVEGPFDSEVNLPERTEEIVRNYVFFENPVFNDDQLRSAFSAYASDCINALKNPFINKGNIVGVDFKIVPADAVEYILHGNLTSPENRACLVKPKEALYSRLGKCVGRIRSVNGIKLL